MTQSTEPQPAVVDLEETDADRAFQPQPNCCEDCDEALDIAAWSAELAPVTS